MIFPQVFLRSMGFGGMSAVLVAMLAALTLLPALLAVLGPRIDALSVRSLVGRRRRRPAHARERDGTWHRIAHSVMRRPVVYAVVVGGLLVALAARSRVGGRRRGPAQAGEGAGTWHRIPLSLMLRPVVLAVVLGGLLVAPALPFARAEFGGTDVRAMPEGAESRVVAETIER